MTTQITDPRRGKPSASSAWRRRNCPGSRNAEPPAGVNITTEIAEEGSLIHRAIETEDFSELSDEQENIATRLTDMAESSFQRWASSFSDGDKQSMAEYREERFWIKNPSNGELMESSQVDRAYVCGDRGYICDFKTGFLTVTPSPKNYQLRVAALALWNTFPNLKEITVCVAQVRFKSNYNECVYGEHELLMSQKEFLLSDWISQQPDAPFSAGEWCSYCPIKADCKTAATYALIAQNSLALTPEAEEGVLWRVNDLNHAQLAKLHSYASISTKVFEAAKERLKGLPEEELNAVGLAKGKPSKVAQVIDIQRAKKLLVETSALVTEDEFNASLKLTLGSVEKIAVGRMAKRQEITQRIAAEQLRLVLLPCLSFTDKSASLVPFVPESKQIQE